MPITINGTDGNPMTARDVDASPNNFIFSQHRLTFSGNYVTGGDTLDFTNGGVNSILDKIATGALPIQAFVEPNGGASGFGFTGGYFVVLSGNAFTNWKVKIFNAGGTELTAAAYPATILADVITLSVLWRKLLTS